MSNLAIPHPKFALNRYNTRQLYAWLEENTLIAETLDFRGRTRRNLKDSDAHNLRISSDNIRAIWCVLRDRGEPVQKIARTIRLTREDFYS